MQLAHRVTVEVEWRDLPAREHLGEIADRRADVADRLPEVGLEVAPPDDALPGRHIDQDEWPLRVAADLGHDRSAHRDRNRSHIDPFQSQLVRDLHRALLGCRRVRAAAEYQPSSRSGRDRATDDEGPDGSGALTDVDGSRVEGQTRSHHLLAGLVGRAVCGRRRDSHRVRDRPGWHAPRVKPDYAMAVMSPSSK